MHSTQIHQNLFRLRMLVILAGVLLMIGGMVMIFMDLKSEGSISVKTPFLTGSINATYIGLLVVFMGVVLAAIAIMRTFTQKDWVEISRTQEAAKKRKQATGCPSEEELRKLFMQRYSIQLPDSLNLADPVMRETMHAILSDSHDTVSSIRPLSRETFKFRNETSGARLASKP